MSDWSPIWETVNGVVKQGHRLASDTDGNSPFGAGTIVLQAPIFKARGVDISCCYMGTLNVWITPATRKVVMPEPTIRDVKWHENYRAENFFLSRCRVAFRGVLYEGWVYYPDPATKEGHFQDPSLLEILLPRIPGIVYGSKVEVLVNSEEVAIDY